MASVAPCRIVRGRGRCRLRAAFTLMELLLVLALLVVLAGIAWPSMKGPLERMRVTDAGRTLKSALARARLEAIDQGQAIAFRYEPSGRAFHYAPHGIIPLAEMSLPGMEDPQGSTADQPLPRTPPLSELPERVAFAEPPTAGGQNSWEQESALAAAELETQQVDTSQTDPRGELDEREWSAPLVFYPDGVSEDQTFYLRSDTGWAIEVQLRGLTGAITVSPITRVEVDEFALDQQPATPTAEQSEVLP